MIGLRLTPVGSRRMGRLTSRRHQSRVMTKHLELATEVMRRFPLTTGSRLPIG
jgi:hypothetical protein